MSKIGENFVSLKGVIKYPNLNVVGQYNTSMFKGKLAAPVDGRFQYIKISAWGDLAEALNEVPYNVTVHIHGHIEERSFDSSCRHCKGKSKTFWTEVVVDNFIIL